jgi:hypothetical protein
MAMFIAVASVQRVIAGEATPATGGDPRSPGEGPGLVGDPVFAIVAVLAVGVASLILTLAYLRLTDRDSRRP